jgi:hypothetical protein
MSAQTKTVGLGLEELGIKNTVVRTLAGSDASLRSVTKPESVTLLPFGSWVGEVK